MGGERGALGWRAAEDSPWQGASGGHSAQSWGRIRRCLWGRRRGRSPPRSHTVPPHTRPGASHTRSHPHSGARPWLPRSPGHRDTGRSLAGSDTWHGPRRSFGSCIHPHPGSRHWAWIGIPGHRRGHSGRSLGCSHNAGPRIGPAHIPGTHLHHHSCLLDLHGNPGHSHGRSDRSLGSSHSAGSRTGQSLLLCTRPHHCRTSGRDWHGIPEDRHTRRSRPCWCKGLPGIDFHLGTHPHRGRKSRGALPGNPVRMCRRRSRQC